MLFISFLKKKKSCPNRIINLQFFPLLRKKYNSERKNSSEHWWSQLGIKTYVLSSSLLNDKKTIFLKKYLPLPIIVGSILHLTSPCNNKQIFFRVHGYLTYVLWLYKRLYLHANRQMKTELIIVETEIEICKYKERWTLLEEDMWEKRVKFSQYCTFEKTQTG